MMITLISGDGFTLFTGFETMSAASWLLVLSYGTPLSAAKAGRLYMTMAIAGALTLLAAMAVGFGTAGDFGAWRAAPPAGARAAAFLLLVLVGAGSKAGLPPRRHRCQR
jgi:formate hydrogenlyase subunit 3/multisubunit Na+/H+ antiporter MnhD subunit